MRVRRNVEKLNKVDEGGVVGQRLEHEKERGGYLSDYRLVELLIMTFGLIYMFYIESTL